MMIEHGKLGDPDRDCNVEHDEADTRKKKRNLSVGNEQGLVFISACDV